MTDINLKQSRIGVLTTPVTPLATGLVVSYSTASSKFTLVVNTTTGMSDVLIGMAVDAGGELVRIKTITVNTPTAGQTTLELAENGVSAGVGGAFASGATINIYNVFYPLPRYQRLAENVVSTIYCSLPSSQFTNWVIRGITADNSDDGCTLYYEFNGGRLELFADVDEEVRTGKAHRNGRTPPVSLNIEPVHQSGLGGSVTCGGVAVESGIIYVAPFVLYKDYDVEWEDLDADNTTRNKLSQAPIPCVQPQCAWISFGTYVTFDAITSFAIYESWGGSPATILSYAWDGGADATYDGDQISHDVVVKWSTSGFRYLKLTIEDSNNVTSVRYIPIWVEITPWSAVNRCDAVFALQQGWQFDLEFIVPPTILRHSLVSVVDLDTKEILFMGYIWPASYDYNFEKATLTISVFTALAFLTHCFSYPFRLTGTKGDAIAWSYLDYNTYPRSVYFLLRWHSNFLEIANARWGTDANDRLIYITDFTAGTLLEQLVTFAESGKLSIYADRFGGFETIESLLYGAAITGTAPLNNITRTLTAGEHEETVGFEYGQEIVSFVRMSAFYFNSKGDVKPVIVSAPSHPGNYGRPDEVGGLWSKNEDPFVTGYQELLRWAGRHIGLSNTARKYTVATFVDVNPSIYRMIDIPGANRIVVESARMSFHIGDNRDTSWTQTLQGRTFGNTADSILVPQASTPVFPPIVPPLPVPEPADAYALWEDNRSATKVIYEDGHTASGWAGNAQVNTAASDKPRIVMDTNKNKYAVWTQGTDIQFSYTVANGTWTTPVAVAAGTEASLAADADGEIHVVWASNHQVWYKKFSPVTQTWGSAELAGHEGTVGVDTASRPRVAVDSSGVVHLSYSLHHSASWGIYYQERSAGAWIEADIGIVADLTNSMWSDIAVDSSGGSYVICHTNDGYYNWVRVYYKPLGSAFEAPTVLSGTGILNYSNGIAIVVSPGDTVCALWGGNIAANSLTRIQSCSKIAGSWGGVELVSDDDTGDRSNVAGCYDPASENFCAVWYDARNGNDDVYFSQHAEITGAWTTNERVNGSTPGAATLPAIGAPLS